MYSLCLSDHAETPQSRLGVLYPRRAPNLGKVRRRSCLRLISFPGIGDVLLAPTMISYPLAYVAPNPRHLWRKSTVEMNSIPWSPVLQYATPLPMIMTPVSTVALQHKSVSSVLRYATPLPMNRIPFRTCPVEHKAVSSVVQYARPRFHRLFRPSPPDEHDHAFRLAPHEHDDDDVSPF